MMITDEVKKKVKSICDDVVAIAEHEAVELIVNKNRTPRNAFEISGCRYHHKRDRKKYRQVQMRAKRQQDKKQTQCVTKRLADATAKLNAHKRKNDSIQDYRREVHRVEVELQESLQRRKELENELKRLRHKYHHSSHHTKNTTKRNNVSLTRQPTLSLTHPHTLTHSLTHAHSVSHSLSPDLSSLTPPSLNTPHREQEQAKQYRAAAKENVALANKTRHTTKRLADTRAKLNAHKRKITGFLLLPFMWDLAVTDNCAAIASFRIRLRIQGICPVLST